MSKIAMTPSRLTVLVRWRHFVYANVAPRCVVVWSFGGGKYDTQELTFGYHQGKKIHESTSILHLRTIKVSVNSIQYQHHVASRGK